MITRKDIPQTSLSRFHSHELLGDIWFYREECRYHKEAWLEYPIDYDPKTLLGNESDKVFVHPHGTFAIPASFYLAPPEDPAEDATCRHYNAVDAKIRLNQLAYVLDMEGFKSGLIPLDQFGVDPHQIRCRRLAVNMMTAEINFTFVRALDPSDFMGRIAVKTIYERKGMLSLKWSPNSQAGAWAWR